MSCLSDEEHHGLTLFAFLQVRPQAKTHAWSIQIDGLD